MKIDARTLSGIFFGWMIGIAATALAAGLEISRPDVLIGFIFLLGLERGAPTGQIVGFGTGLVIDILGYGIIGPSAGAYLLAGYCGGLLGAHYTERRIAFAIPAFPILAISADLLALGLSRTAGLEVAFDLDPLFKRTLVTAAFAPIPFLFYRPLGLGRRGG